MKIDGQSDLAFRVLLRAPESRWSIAAAAEAIGAPANHVAKVVNRMAELGLIETIRGRGGGFEVHPSTLTMSVGDILRSLEGDAEPARCEANGCPLVSLDCSLRHHFDRARHAFFQALDDVNLISLRTNRTVVDLPNP